MVPISSEKPLYCANQYGKVMCQTNDVDKLEYFAKVEWCLHALSFFPEVYGW